MPWHLIVGMLNTKDETGFLRPLAPLARSITTVPVPDEPASRTPAEAARLAARARFQGPAGGRYRERARRASSRWSVVRRGY